VERVRGAPHVAHRGHALQDVRRQLRRGRAVRRGRVGRGEGAARAPPRRGFFGATRGDEGSPGPATERGCGDCTIQWARLPRCSACAQFTSGSWGSQPLPLAGRRSELCARGQAHSPCRRTQAARAGAGMGSHCLHHCHM
jgi:hypothetical protein